MLNFIIYTVAFITGAFLGSFCTLAVYRIPLKQDITHEHSYCPNCKHRLNVLDLIPILSYLFLGGKCRYCKEKVRIRYLIIEVLFGIVYTLFIMSLNINFLGITVQNIADIVIGTIYFVVLFLIAGIDKEYHTINKSVFNFGIICTALYIVYLYIVHVNIYRYVIYLAILLLLIIAINILKKKNDYIFQILTLSIFMALITDIRVTCITVLFTLVTVLIKRLFAKNGKNYLLPIGFYLCIYNIGVLIIMNLFKL